MPLRLTIAISLLLLSACSKEAPPKQLTEVIVDSAGLEVYTPSSELIGRLEAFEDVELKANINGYLIKRSFKEGEYIEKGTSLFLVDPATYQAELSTANAEVSRAEAASKVAVMNFNRGSELRPKGYISASEYDQLNSEKLQASANLKGAHAKLARAQVNLDFTDIKAPFSGTISRSVYSVGDLVGPESGALATLVNIHPIQVIFQISEKTYIRYNEANLAKETPRTPQENFIVRLELSTGNIYPHSGKIDYISNRVDTETGTIEGRAIIPNPEGTLKPGQYTKVFFDSVSSIKALFIPQTAVQADQQGDFVLTVDANNKVIRKNVELGTRVKDKVIVEEGLIEQEQIIIRGLQLVRSGQLVDSKHINSASPSTKSVQ